VLYLLDVYSAGENPIAEATSRRLYESLRARGHLSVRYLGDELDPATIVANESANGDVIVTLGAGDIYKLGERVLTVLGDAAGTAAVKSDERA
jgi:UDP-N-acetylmuramate--alanine ligase